MTLSITSVTPNLGPTTGGTDITVNGTGFQSGNVVLLCQGDGEDSGFSDVKGTQIVSAGSARLSSTNSKFGGSSAYFDGYTSLLNITNAVLRFGTLDFTIEFWIYCNTNPGTGTLYPFTMSSSIYNANGGFHVTINGPNTGWGDTGKINFNGSTGSNGPALSSTSTIRNAGWKHIAITRNGAQHYLFVDGVLEAQAAAASANYTGNAGYLCAPVQADGAYPTYAGATEHCYIDELRITHGVARYTANFIPPTQPYPDNAQEDPHFANVVLLMHMDGSEISTIADSSGYGNDLTVVGGTKRVTSHKKYGTASIYFDSSGDCLKIENPSARWGQFLSDFTVECWVYLTATPNSQQFLQILGQANWPEYANTGAWWWFYATTSSIGFDAVHDGAAAGVSSSGALELNTWHHLAFSKQGLVGRLFRNGALASESTNFAKGIFINDTRRFTVGADNDYVHSNLKGYVDDIRITKGLAVYTSSFNVPTQSLKNHAARVAIDGNLCLQATVVSDTAITAKTPPGSAGAKDVVVTV